MTLAEALSLISVLFAIVMLMVTYIWRDLKKQVDELSKEFKASSQAALATRVKRLENDYHLIHDWKNKIFPGDLENLRRGLREYYDRIEREIRDRLERLERGTRQ